ncbi:LOW QUALITY PROTEIN: hypothetical protein MKX08_002051 [Trichoderma sp. CBMAI-0020]|nr:LOW QUALITY PROTEIN: hypothetical protein MKX08_002051 [Trichoderma sp. CBMAI-0020]
MRFENSYVSYKRDTSLLLYWMIKTSNPIIQNLNDSGHNVALEINATGQITVSDLVPMSELIAKYHPNIPSTIYHLFLSVIKLRHTYYSRFQQLAELNPSEKLEKSNTTHKYFIDALTSTFETLGGEKWLSQEREKRANNAEEEEIDPNSFTFTNKFSALDLENDILEADSEESDKDSAPSQKQRKLRKNKKRVKGKKAQRNGKSSQSDGRALDIALESYRIIEEDDASEYAMAVLALTRDMIQFRLFLQGIWRKVAYRNLNSAVAAATSNIAVAMIKQYEATIFIDFLGYESFERIKQAIMHGEDEKANREMLCCIRSESDGKATVTPTTLDKKELFLIYTYHDLVDFITDYQKTRSGKPTKRMLAQIDNWNPDLDLQKATKEERVKWRRSYTINWLYDLVNITACVAMHGENAKKENYVLEQMDWSNQGPLKPYHRMFGLTNFAAAVTTLAMQKHGTDFRHSIPPHLVFHLQCIIDAWTMSRGWALSWLKGHILSEPAQTFRPRRDLDIFLGNENLNDENGNGYFLSVACLKMNYLCSNNFGKGFEYTESCLKALMELAREFRDALGKCKIFQSLSGLLPSRFASTNPNGAWDYSPFFCGAGLVEGLELSYRSAMTLWEGMLEPTLIIHLHNMLVKKGYLKQEISLYSGLGWVLSDTFFTSGQPPTSNYVEAFRSQFGKAFRAHFSMSNSRKATNCRAGGKITNARDFLNLTPLRLFKQKSSLQIYGSADWNPDRVPESDVDPKSSLGLIRLSQTRRVRDPVTSVWRLEETDLVKRTHAAGMDESYCINTLGPIFERFKDERQVQTARVRSMQDRASWDTNKTSKGGESSFETANNEVTAERMLRILYGDLHGDICGSRQPLSSLCYIAITVQMLLFFQDLESELQNSSSATIRSLFAGDTLLVDSHLRSYQRLQVTLRALGGKDRELLTSMAKVFEGTGGEFSHNMYWHVEDDEPETGR